MAVIIHTTTTVINTFSEIMEGPNHRTNAKQCG